MEEGRRGGVGPVVVEESMKSLGFFAGIRPSRLYED